MKKCFCLLKITTGFIVLAALLVGIAIADWYLYHVGKSIWAGYEQINDGLGIVALVYGIATMFIRGAAVAPLAIIGAFWDIFIIFIEQEWSEYKGKQPA